MLQIICASCNITSIDDLIVGIHTCQLCHVEYEIPANICFECAVEKHRVKEHYSVSLI